MAAIRTHLFSSLINKAQIIQKCRSVAKLQDVAPAYHISARSSSFQSSPQVRPLEEYPEVEVLHNPPEWKFVERILPPKVVPKPIAKEEYASGWKLPTAVNNSDQLKYFVARTKNYMVPVYLQTSYRGERRITVVKRIQGDIWALERDVRAVVEKARGRVCATRVNEMSGQLFIHGDYVDVVREYLKENGF